MFDRLVAATTGTAGAESAEAWTRVESAACARRLSAMVTVLDTAYAASGSADREQWCIDNWSAVCDHIGATQARTSGQISSLLLVGTALRDRFPRVQALFAAGRIDYRTARTVVMRCLLVQGTRALHALDAALARALGAREPMSQERLENAIDGHIARLDPDAVRRTQTRARSRNLDITYDEEGGMAEVIGTLFAHDAHALDTRLTAMAATVCPSDPRTKGQLRADASGALSLGQDRMACLCNTADCTAAQNPPSTGVVIHLVVREDTLTPPGEHGPGDDPPPPDGPGPGGGGGPDPVEPVAEPTVDETVTDGTDLAENDGATSEFDADTHPGHDRAPFYGASRPECGGLDGHHTRQFPRPVSLMMMTKSFTACEHRPAHVSTLPPAMLLGGHVLPGAIAHRAAQHATIRPIVHPGHAPPEPHYRPSRKLADFVRARDHTCRYPGCRTPATQCDVDHTIPWPYGPTQAANLKCLCRRHHLLKTFWTQFRDRQLPNGDVIWTTPDGREHATTPGSRLLFPELSTPTAPVHARDVPLSHEPGLKMPRRKATRTEDRKRSIRHERRLNHDDDIEYAGAQPDSDDPPF